MTKLTKAQRRLLAEIELHAPFGLYLTLFEKLRAKRLLNGGLIWRVNSFAFITDAGRAALSLPADTEA